MEIDEEHPDYSKHMIEALKRVGQSVREEHRSKGVPMYYEKDHWLVMEYPNGSIVGIKRLCF